LSPPATVTEGRLAVLAENQVNRISIGIESFRNMQGITYRNDNVGFLFQIIKQSPIDARN